MHAEYAHAERKIICKSKEKDLKTYIISQLFTIFAL